MAFMYVEVLCLQATFCKQCQLLPQRVKRSALIVFVYDVNTMYSVQCSNVLYLCTFTKYWSPKKFFYEVRMINFYQRCESFFKKCQRGISETKNRKKRKHNANAQHNMGKNRKNFQQVFSVRMNMNDVLPCSLYYFSSHSLRITFFTKQEVSFCHKLLFCQAQEDIDILLTEAFLLENSVSINV